MEDTEDTRKRTKRACDLCNQKRIKCDGDFPTCDQCQRSRLACSYNREEKKRGRASLKYPKTITRRKPTKKERLKQLAEQAGLPAIYARESSACRFKILQPYVDELEKLGLSAKLACDLYEHYFRYTPLWCVAPVLRPRNWLVPATSQQTVERHDGTKLALVLSVLLTSLCDIGHPFFLGSFKKDLIGACYAKIMELLPPQASYDDVLVYLHLSNLSPAITKPRDAFKWIQMACESAVSLKLNHELQDLSVSEEDREERRRCWWCIVIVSNYVCGIFNVSPILMEYESQFLYQPCSEPLWLSMTEPLIPAKLDPKRQKGLELNMIRDGVYGWMLPVFIILGRIDSYAVDRWNISEEGYVDAAKQAQYIQQLVILDRTLELCHDSHRINDTDYLFCKMYTMILMNVMQRPKIWDPAEVFDTPQPIAHLTESHWVFEVTGILDRLYSDQGTLRVQALTRGFFLFMLGIELLSLTDSIASADEAKLEIVTKLRYASNLVLRSMESLNSYITTEYVRLLITYIRDSLRDLDNLVLLNDYERVLDENRQRRRSGVSVFSWRRDGNGISL